MGAPPFPERETAMSELFDKLEKDLSTWRTKLDELRVQANLGKLELRDRHPELVEDFDAAYENAKEGLGKLGSSGVSTARTVVDGLEAGWEELRGLVDKVRRRGDK